MYYDVATMNVGDRDISGSENSELIYFVKGDGDATALYGDRGPPGPTGVQGIAGPIGALGKRGIQGQAGPTGKVGRIGPVGGRGDVGIRGEQGKIGEQGIKGERGLVGPIGKQGEQGRGEQGEIGEQGIKGERGEQGIVGSTGPAGKQGEKGSRGSIGDPSDVLPVMCDYLPFSVAADYRSRIYFRYAFNTSGDVEMEGKGIKTLVDKGGRANAVQSDVTRMATVLRVNKDSFYNFHGSAYNIQASMDFKYFCMFFVYKIKSYESGSSSERNYLMCNRIDEKKDRFRGICFLKDEKTLRIHGASEVGDRHTFDFRWWVKTNPCEKDKFHVVCIEYVKKPKSSSSSLWVNGAYVSNFDSECSFGEGITLGNICNGGSIPVDGAIV